MELPYPEISVIKKYKIKSMLDNRIFKEIEGKFVFVRKIKTPKYHYVPSYFWEENVISLVGSDEESCVYYLIHETVHWVFRKLGISYLMDSEIEETIVTIIDNGSWEG